MKNKQIYLPISILILLFLSASYGCREKKTKTTTITEQDSIDHRLFILDICIDSLDVEDNLLKSGENLSSILSKNGISAAKIDSISKKCQTVFDITKLKAGKEYKLLRDSSMNNLLYLIYEDSPITYIVFNLQDTLNIYQYNKEIKNIRKTTAANITSSLWNAVADNGLDPLLSSRLENIYAWQIDFFGIAKNDWFKVIYDQACIDDSVEVAISEIKGAIFSHMGKEYYAIPFVQDSIIGYYDENGQNLQKAFLKAPLKYSRISSRFSNARRHPILKITRPHHGIDYAAPTGTPVVSIGDGTVIKKGYQGGGGNFISIRHNTTYTTTYMHLSRFAKGIQPGKRVRQGELIGYVGSTGLSSGPHLDFRVFQSGRPINPLSMYSPPADSIKTALKDSFNIVKEQIIREITAIPFQENRSISDKLSKSN